MTQPATEYCRGTRILSLDGGGMRGLVEIHILRYLSSQMFGDPTGRKLIDSFDLIAGTSTGGILAVSLALGKTLDECESLYLRLGASLFGSKTSHWAARILRYWWSGDFYSSSYLEEFIKTEFPAAASPLSECIPQKAKVCLVATEACREIWSTFVFKSYENLSSKYKGSSTASVLEALRSTSAAPGYFKPETFGNHRMLDGGLVANNPAEVALMEGLTLWPDRPVDLLLSLGTGDPDNPSISHETIKNLVLSIVDMETSSTVIHNRLQNWLSVAFPATHYFRFSPPHLGSFQLDESNEQNLKLIMASTNKYLIEETGEKLSKLIEVFKQFPECEGVHFPKINPFPPPRLETKPAQTSNQPSTDQ